jgi:hypothetical protein
MTSRELLRAALDHRCVPRVPIDLGGTFITGIHCSVVAGLREHLGLERRPVRVHEPYQMLGLVDDDLCDALGVDVDGIVPAGTMFGVSNHEPTKSWRTPWGQEVLVPQTFAVREDPATGDVYTFPQGDTSVLPSCHMPKGGYFFDAIIRQEPIDEDHLDPADNLEEFGPIADVDLQYLKRQVEAALPHQRGIIAALPGTGLGDIALVPAAFLKHPRGIRDITEWYVSTVTRPDYIRAIFDKQVQIALSNLQRIHDTVGDAFDAVVVCGTDFGTQCSQFCSLDTLRDLWLPYYQQINGWIHQHTAWRTFKHSCGAVAPFIDTFIEAGFDILNPVQCSATGMDPQTLKDAYGDRITFWGGGVDTQHVLPFGTPDEVRAQVLQRCEIFARGGGFVFNTIHNIQARTPLPNLLAMLDALRLFNGRPATTA